MNHTTGIGGEMTVTARAAGRRRPGREGFTLTEIMIALGVLVTGMSMVAGAMQAGLRNHTTTVDDIIRTIVAENGLAEVKARLMHTGSASPTNGLTGTPTVIVDSVSTTPPKGMGPADRRSPYFGGLWNNGIGGTFYGYCVIGWRPTSTCSGTDFKNDYCFSIIPYKIIPGDGTNGVPKGVDYYKTDYVDTYATNPSYVPMLADLVLPDGSTVTKITYRQPAEKTYFCSGAVVLAVPANTNQVQVGIVDSAGASGMTVQLKSQLIGSDGKGINASLGLSVLIVKNSAGQPDATGAVTPLKPYMARTALTPYQP